MKKRTALIISVLFFTLAALGQNQENNVSSHDDPETLINLQRTIKLENDSETEDILIDIREGTQKYSLLINSSLNKGKLTIEVYDPSGTKQGNFTISTQLNSGKKEMVRGNINKSMTDPQPGKWKIRLIPSNATGNINIQSSVIE